LGLRTKLGVSVSRVKPVLVMDEILSLIDLKLLTLDEDQLAATNAGMNVLDSLFPKILH
jgi:hypothetical protein